MEELTFEKAVERLEEIVQALDGGEVSLSESLALFEEGVKLAGECSKQLADAQGKLETLVKKANGSLETAILENA